MRACLVLLTAALLALAPGALRADLVAYYAADGSTTDGSGFGNHGTLHNGAGYSSGHQGQGFTFDGVNDYVTAPDSASLDMSTQLTLSLWVRPESGGASGGHTGLVWKGNDIDSSSNQSYALLYTNRVFFRVGGSPGTFAQLDSGSVLPLGEYSHIAATFDGSTMRTYVNGELTNSRTYNVASIRNTDYPLFIGSTSDGAAPSTSTSNNRHFHGSLDEIRIYDTALDATQVAALVSVPEPGSLLCFSLITGGFLARRRRQR